MRQNVTRKRFETREWCHNCVKLPAPIVLITTGRHSPFIASKVRSLKATLRAV